MSQYLLTAALALAIVGVALWGALYVIGKSNTNVLQKNTDEVSYEKKWVIQLDNEYLKNYKGVEVEVCNNIHDAKPYASREYAQQVARKLGLSSYELGVVWVESSQLQK